MKRNNVLFAVCASMIALTGITLTGCSDKTQEAASNTVENAGQDAANHTAAAGQAVEKTGETVAEAGKTAVDATGKAVDATGKAVANGAEMTGEAVGGAVKGAAKETADIGQIATLTPAIKSAIIASKIDGSTIDVDTSGEKDTVILKGTVKSDAEKKQAAMIAMKTIKDQGKTFKVKNELTVAK